MSTTEKILQEFLKNRDRTVSGETLAETFGLSRTAVWMHIETLRKVGFVFEAGSRIGYRLTYVPEKLIPELILDGLKTTILGRKIFVYESLESTNSTALKMADEGMNEGALVLSETQEKGRGRLGRHWFSRPEESLTFSLILKPKLPPTYIGLLTVMASLAVARCLKDMNFKVSIKWPNDVLINGKKVAGILTEVRTDQDSMNYAILGIGINVNMDLTDGPIELKEHATSLMSERGQKINRLRLLQDIIYSLECDYSRLKKMETASILEEWSAYSDLTGKWVNVVKGSDKDQLSGIMIGTDQFGAMLLRTSAGIIETVMGGDVSLGD